MHYSVVDLKDRKESSFHLSVHPCRNYNSSIGRFTSRDTFDGNTVDPISLNHYVYANANPIENIDPSGNTTTREGQAAHKAIGAIYAFDHLGSHLDFGIKPYSGGKKLMADIINYTGLGPNHSLLAEIQGDCTVTYAPNSTLCR